MSDASDLRTVTTNMVVQISALMAEFKASGLPIDDFLKQKLKQSRPDGDQYAERMLKTFSEIDANYSEIQNARANGINRQEWIRDNIEKSISGANADKKRDVVGEVLGRSLAVVKGENTNQAGAVPFEGIDAVEAVESIEQALANSAIASTMTGSAREEF